MPRLPLLLASLTILLVVGCSLMPGASPSIPANTPVVPPGVSGRLLYTRDGGLWTLALQTGRATQIVAPPDLGQVTAARWSPDGTRVAYAFVDVQDRRVPVFELRVSAADGSGMQKLSDSEGTAGTVYTAPKWGPDGTHLYLAMVGFSEGQRVRRIERLDLASGTTTPVFSEVGGFDVSADGRWLALAPASEVGGSIVLVDLASGEQRTIVERGRFENIAALRFDPSARTVLFTAAASTGSAPPASLDPSRPAPALLGAGRAYAHGLPQDVYAVSLSGGVPSRAVQVGADEPAIAPSPDGSHLAILSAESLAIAPLAGGKPIVVLTPGGLGTIDWAP